MNRVRSLSLRARLTTTLVVVALVSVVLIGGYNFVQARSLLNTAIDEQLSALTAARAQALGQGADQLRAQVSAIARDQSVVEALTDLEAGYDVLRDADVPPEQTEAVRRYYEDTVLTAFEEAGLEPPSVDELVPATPAGTALQYLYIAENPFPPDERRDLDTAGDDSLYSEAHAIHHPFLRSLADQTGSPDILLVSADDGSIVYTVDKHIDFGTNLVIGPEEESAVAEIVLDRLTEATVGDAVFVDFSPYIPAGAAPTMFVAAAVRSDTEVIGAVLTQVPGSALTDLTTAGGNFEDLGLGTTGETYIVGPDRLMRSDSRLFIEDPETYLERFRSEGYDEVYADRIETFGTTAFLQPVDNAAIDEALSGNDYLGRVQSYLGEETLVAARPAGVPGLDWVIVAEMATSETRQPLMTYLRRILVVALVLLPVVAVIAALLARTLTRPIDPLVRAADEVAAGDLAVELPDLGRNEIGDLARQLNSVTADLRLQEAALMTEEAEIDELLNAALPPWLATKVRDGGDDLTDLVDTVTVVSASIDGLPDIEALDSEDVAEMTATITEIVEGCAADLGLDRIRSSSDHHLFLAGVGSDGFAAGDALRFVGAVQERLVEQLDEAAPELRLRAGIAAGEVAVGVVGQGKVSVSVWGDAASAALMLDALAGPGQVLVGSSVTSVLPEGTWVFEETALVGLDESEAFSLVGPDTTVLGPDIART